MALFDAAIIGGGPAGSTAAATLARMGRSVLVIERERFPRFHIGESLLPYNLPAFKRLGLLEKLDTLYLTKHGAEISTACGTRSLRFHFRNGFRLKHHHAYQVERATFDKLLLERARELGAEVLQETAVESVEFHPDRVALTLKGGGRLGEPALPGGSRTVEARFLIDASGRHSLVGSHFNLKKSYPHLQKFSCYAHFEDVTRAPGEDGGLTGLVRARDHWFWLIPLGETRMSIGVVMDTARFRSLKQSPEAVLEESIRACPPIQARMTNATRVTPVHSTADYSYRNAQLAGERWLMAGDAAGFIDPIFSTGVYLAVDSGERAALAIDQALKNPKARDREFGRYAKYLNRVMDLYLRFVTAWYRPEFIEVVCQPTERFQLVPAINAVLAGNLDGGLAIRWRMELFYLILAIQRRFALVPRLSLVPEPEKEPC